MICNFPFRKTSRKASSEELSSSLDTEFLNQFTWRDVHKLEDDYFNSKLIQISIFYDLSHNLHIVFESLLWAVHRRRKHAFAYFYPLPPLSAEYRCLH